MSCIPLYKELIFGFILVLLSGCATLASKEAPIVCIGADVATTITGIKTGKMVEQMSIVKTSINAGHFLPFVSIALISAYIIYQINNSAVNSVVSTFECGLSLNNLRIILK